ncbi:MAG: lipocalin family protein [Chloroflexota bacterium]
MTRWAAGLLAILAAVAINGCTRAPARPLAPAVERPSAVLPPVRLPQDEGPHDDLTEWWYYTGHLDAADGRTWGFELVVFQVLRNAMPPLYLSHFAITDIQRGRFTYAQRRTQGPQPQPERGFALDVDGWRMGGADGSDRISASMPDYAIDLSLESTKPPALHGGGLVTFGVAGDSYYFSRTNMRISGTISDPSGGTPVSGVAWFDRQWGNFLVLGGGWDWFSMHLDDGSELMLNLIRDDTHQVRMAYGTVVERDGTYAHLDAEAFEVSPRGQWVSPHSGAAYPGGWEARVPSRGLSLTIEPLLKDQELRTGQTTGNTYWEGACRVVGNRAGWQVTGRAYVELTGYAPAASR